MALYRLKSGQKHSMRVGRTIRPLAPGEEVELTPTQAQAFRDKFDFVSEGRKKEALKTTEAPKLRKEPHAYLDDKFDVIHPETGAPINDEPLSEEEADALVAGV